MIRNVLIVIAFNAILTKSTGTVIDRSPRSVDTCGVQKTQSGLIVRGQDFPRGTFPWIVTLMYTETRPKFFCAGTLISKTFVISGRVTNPL